MKKVILSILDKIEEQKKEKRFFEKISFEQFEKDISKLLGTKLEEKEVKKIYENIDMPLRGTGSSAGYDFSSPIYFILKPGEKKVVPTGIKASMNRDEALMIYVRSSVGFKYNVRLTNQVGVIDSDYYNNDSNEGHIMISFQNHGEKDWVVDQKNKRVAQGVFAKYYTVRKELNNKKRKGGIGSTN